MEKKRTERWGWVRGFVCYHFYMFDFNISKQNDLVISYNGSLMLQNCDAI